MSMFIGLMAIAALICALAALSRGRTAVERADDAMKFLSEFRNRASGDMNVIFRELHRTIARQRQAEGKMKVTPYEITDACVACGACEPECPEDAIVEGDIFRIIPEKCAACKKCVKACPVDACVPMVLD